MLIRLKEWLGKKAEKDRERAREKQERRERRLAMPNHKFEDEDYHEQRKKVAENQEDALLQGNILLPVLACTVEPVESDTPRDQGNVSNCTGYRNTQVSDCIYIPLITLCVHFI